MTFSADDTERPYSGGRGKGEGAGAVVCTYET